MISNKKKVTKKGRRFHYNSAIGEINISLITTYLQIETCPEIHTKNLLFSAKKCYLTLKRVTKRENVLSNAKS